MHRAFVDKFSIEPLVSLSLDHKEHVNYNIFKVQGEIQTSNRAPSVLELRSTELVVAIQRVVAEVCARHSSNNLELLESKRATKQGVSIIITMATQDSVVLGYWGIRGVC